MDHPDENKQMASHGGVFYLAFLKMLADTFAPRSYFEIGTDSGSSARLFSCPTICVDPDFKIDTDIIGSKRHLHLFQMRSDEFFASFDLRRLFPEGVDLAFLDGMHNFEFLLRDFANTERQCHRRSLILLHDCLPTNYRMARRVFELGPEEETTRYSWTGDVWKILPTLKEFRPDLRIFLLDCETTGLVACTNLDPGSTALQDNYFAAIDRFGMLNLREYGFDQLFAIYPMLRSAEFGAAPQELHLRFTAGP